MRLNKKAASNWGIVIIIIVIIIGWWLVTVVGRECSQDNECGGYQYCGSDFECHDKEVVYVEKNSLLLPSAIIALGIIIATIIIRWKNLKSGGGR